MRAAHPATDPSDRIRVADAVDDHGEERPVRVQVGCGNSCDRSTAAIAVGTSALTTQRASRETLLPLPQKWR